MNIGRRLEHRAETVALQEAILRGEAGTLDGRPIYFPQFQNRILFPIVATATVMSLRWGLGGMRAVAGPDMPLGYTIGSIRAFLRHPSPHDWPMLLLALLILCAAAVWHRPVSREQAAILTAGVLMAFLSAIGGAAEELRIYVPTITVAIMAGAVLKTED